MGKTDVVTEVREMYERILNIKPSDEEEGSSELLCALGSVAGIAKELADEIENKRADEPEAQQPDLRAVK